MKYYFELRHIASPTEDTVIDIEVESPEDLPHDTYAWLTAFYEALSQEMQYGQLKQITRYNKEES